MILVQMGTGFALSRKHAKRSVSYQSFYLCAIKHAKCELQTAQA